MAVSGVALGIYFARFYGAEEEFFWGLWCTLPHVVKAYVALQKSYFYCPFSPSYDWEAV